MFSIRHSDGSGEEDPPLEGLSALYDELLTADQEHGDVSVVIDDTGWSISAHRDGRLVFENVDTGGERHMIPVPKEQVLALWLKLIAGDFAALEAEPWKPGYVEKG
jgi:hypothetical protein